MRNKQAGKTNKLLLAVIAIGLLFGGFFVYKKRNQIINQVSSITTQITETVISDPEPVTYSGYGIQLMATRQFNQAERVMYDFARDGYSAFIVQGQTRRGAIYKVRIGPYPHRSEAIAIKDKLKRRYARNRYVRKSIIIKRP